MSFELIRNQFGSVPNHLLANTDAWKSMGNRFSGEHLMLQKEDVIGLVVIIIFFVVGYFVLQWLALRQKSGAKHCPKDLFRELCEAHGLERQDRKLLVKIANTLELSDRTGLFVRPDLFERQLVLEAVGIEPSRKLKTRLFE